ncbi:DNA polymerase [Serratia nevei]|uniref:DNA polymerase n=1 Tax=Serratia nevei TaxID=2703794 RepID=UPI00313E7197
MPFEKLFLDTETYSEADLKKCGAYAYAEHPSTEIMICTYAFDDEKVQVWDATDGSRMPRDLKRALRELAKPGTECRLVMQNGLLFDRLLMRECWGYDIPPANIEDTMIMAFRHALPGSLDALCTVLGVDEQNAKDKAGKALINRFCKPTPKSYKVRRYTSATHPDEWAKFIKYARSDILAMREVYYRMPTWGNTEKENEILVLDQKINDRGFCVDVDLAKAAIEAVTRHKQELQAEAAKEYGSGLTGASFLPTLRELAPAHEILNAQKSTLNDLLADPDLPDEARELIEMRLGAASTASTKYAPLLLGLSRDGRRRGCLQYGGAKRTLRWAGKGFQPQNLARGYYADEELDKGIAALLKGRAHRRFDVSKLAATTVRSCIVPEKGKKFVVADYSNVEGRGLAWIAGEQTALDVFAAGTDIYKVLASTAFKVPYDEVTKDQRQIAKAMILGLGYGGGVAAFLTFAKNLGLDLFQLSDDMAGTFPDHIWAAARRGFEFARIQEKNKRAPKGKKAERPSYDLPRKVWMTCDALKRMYREANPAIVEFWQDLEDAAQAAIKNPGRAFWAGARVRENGDRAVKITRTFTRDENGDKVPGWWLKVELPSGRVLSYPGVGLSVEIEVDEETGKKNKRVRIKYQGENQTTRQWGWQFTYGGKLAENIVQALCRDLLAWSMPVVEAAGYPIILSVHDELITETPDDDRYNVAELEAAMCHLPSWARGFPLVAEGDCMYRYRK